MIFEMTERARDLHARVSRFMDEHVFPAEAGAPRIRRTSGTRAVLEHLNADRRRAGPNPVDPARARSRDTLYGPFNPRSRKSCQHRPCFG